MDTGQRVWLGGYSILVLLALSRHFVFRREVDQLTFLRPGTPEFDEFDAPLVSIMVPAKDEEDSIESCLNSLLAQDYPNFEVLVVDDRSTDRTAEIVAQMAEDDNRLRLVQIEQLPDGWTGKTHALHVCRQQARGEWFLFVDADTTQHPGCLTSVMHDALEHNVGMESLLPAIEARSFWERVVQPYAGTLLVVLFPLSRVNNPRQQNYGFANGQFILVRRDVYEAIGGHEAVRDRFVEDIHLGRNVRQGGHNLRVVMGADVSSVRMYSSLGAIVRGWSRILYSAVDCRTPKLWMLITFIVLLAVTPYLTIAGCLAAMAAGYAPPFVLAMLGLGVVHEAAQLALYARTYAITRSDRRYLVFRWLAVGAMLYILGRTIRMCRTHQVTWRGTTYDASQPQLAVTGTHALAQPVVTVPEAASATDTPAAETLSAAG